MRLADVARARRDPSLVVLEGFHAVKHALRFGGELLGAWCADAAEIEALRARMAPDVTLAPTEVDRDELAAQVPRAQLLAVARRPEQPSPLVALDPDGAPGTLPPRAVVAFGTERDGLSPELLARADLRLALPMRPGVSSLNLATAVSATLYSMRGN